MFCPFLSSATFFVNCIWLRMKLSKQFRVSLPDMISAGVQIWTVRWPLFLLNHLRTVRIQALLLLSDTCFVPSPMHLAESAAPSGSSRFVVIIIIIRSRKQQRSAASTQSGHDDEPWRYTLQHECWRVYRRRSAGSMNGAGVLARSRLQSSMKFGSMNIFSYCLRNISTIILQWHHCHVKLLLLFVEISENWVTENLMLKNLQVAASNFK